MPKPETVDALHPDPDKNGRPVDRESYEAMKAVLLRVIPADAEGVRFSALKGLARPHLPPGTKAHASPGWWATTVKLDLEARGMIERVPGASPQRVRRVHG